MSVLARVKAVTGWTDAQLAKALGVSRQLVTAYAAGRRPERLTADQLAVLRGGLAKRKGAVSALLQDLEQDQ